MAGTPGDFDQKNDEQDGTRTTLTSPDAAGPGAPGQATVTASAARDAYAAGHNLSINEGVGAKRLLVIVSGAVLVIILAVACVMVFAVHDARDTQTPPLSVYERSAVRTPRAWAAQVNAVCRRNNPKLVADLNRINGFSQSDYGSVLSPMNPALVQAWGQLYSDYSRTAALVQAVPEPTVQDAAVSDWLTDLANRNATLSKADNDISGVSSNPFDRITAFYEIEKFVSETNTMHPLAAQIGVPECV